MALPPSGEGGDGTVHWLLLRHFPQWLTPEDKESLLRHFGAEEVVVMPIKGRMKNCVFAAFSTQSDATQAMGKLHQLDVFGKRLVVEYANNSNHGKLMQETKRDRLLLLVWGWVVVLGVSEMRKACAMHSKRWSCNTSPWSEQDEETKDDKEASLNTEKDAVKSTSPLPVRSRVRYKYPPATQTILTNITSALMCVPEFYQQVLHLMNKMNLPPPFGSLTPIPPILSPPIPLQAQFQAEAESKDEKEEEGSEIESDEEERVKRKREKMPATSHIAKRRKVSYKQVKNLQSSLKKTPGSDDKQEITPLSSQVKIALKVPSELVPRAEESESNITYIEPISSKKPAQPSSMDLQSNTEESLTATEPEVKGGAQTFITLSELNSNRLTQTEMQESHVYRNYSAGEASTRLYVKNLAKQVEEKDLHYIFGRYINWEIEAQINMFDIRLMQTGRMKGQAFIGLPDEGVAKRALQDTNGYILHNKPMVVHFARSTKPKTQDQ